MSRSLAFIVFAVLATAPSARAAAPVDLGPGRGAKAIVDAQGTAHVVFRSNGYGDQPPAVTYCRLPRNAPACDARTVLAVPEHPDVVRIGRLADARVLIAAEVSDGVAWWVFTGGDPLDAGACTARRFVRGRRPVLAAGPRGIFMLEDRHIATELLSGLPAFAVHSFDARRLRWRSARPAGADQSGLDANVLPNARNADLEQDARGRLHLLSPAVRTSRAWQESRLPVAIPAARLGAGAA